MSNKKLFLMEGYGLSSFRGKWNKLDSSTNIKTLIKKMNKYNKEWDGDRNFAIVKSRGAVEGKHALRDAIGVRGGRNMARKRGDPSWRVSEWISRKHGWKSNKGYFGEILKLQVRDW